MTETRRETAFWKLHKHIGMYTKDPVKHLRVNNVNISKVYIIIGSFFSSVNNLPFTKRSLSNLCGQLSKEQADDNVYYRGF